MSAEPAGWRERWLHRHGPGVLSGMTLGTWLRVLREHRFSVDPPYLGRAAVVTGLSVLNTAAAGLEAAMYGRRIAATEVPPPLFVLGIFRSGTTFLQSLLARDTRFATPNFFEASFPHAVLTGQRIVAPAFNWLLPGRRPQGDTPLDFNQPHEEEFALCGLLGRSLLLDTVFPRNVAFHRRYYTLAELSPRERADWEAALLRFVRTLTLRYGGRPLILKSPGHTARIPTLLRLFPEAKFVHIARNPYDVFRSWRHMAGKVGPAWRLQRDTPAALEGDILDWYAAVYDRYLVDREAIPAGRLFEMSYEHLRDAPLDTVQTIYEHLNLPDYAAAAPAMQAAIAHTPPPPPDRHTPLPAALREQIANRWSGYFAAFGYEI